MKLEHFVQEGASVFRSLSPPEQPRALFKKREAFDSDVRAGSFDLLYEYNLHIFTNTVKKSVHFYENWFSTYLFKKYYVDFSLNLKDNDKYEHIHVARICYGCDFFRHGTIYS